MEIVTDNGERGLSPRAPNNGNTYILIGNLLPDQLKKLLLNSEVLPNPGIDIENDRENVEATRPGYHIESVGGSSPTIIAENEITSEPEVHDNDANSSHTLIKEESISIISSRGEMVTLESSEAKSREILKSIVFGGLTELVTSLGIVTSAAGTHTATGKIVALSLSSLVVRLFVLGYKIADLWTNKNQSESNETEVIGEEVDQYEELLGDRQNWHLHFTMAILSFLLFGLMPPLVYGFTFPRPEDKDLKILALTGVSILCIGLLAVLKAHIQRSENCLVYIKTIGNYIIDGIGASVVTSFAGDLIEKYIEQAGWFEPNKTPTLILSDMAFTNCTWKSPFK